MQKTILFGLALVPMTGCFIGDFRGADDYNESACWVGEDGAMCESGDYDDDSDDEPVITQPDGEYGDGSEDGQDAAAAWAEPGVLGVGGITEAMVSTDGSILFQGSVNVHLYGGVELVDGYILSETELLVLIHVPADAAPGPVDCIFEHEDGSVDLAQDLFTIANPGEAQPDYPCE